MTRARAASRASGPSDMSLHSRRESRATVGSEVVEVGKRPQGAGRGGQGSEPSERSERGERVGRPERAKPRLRPRTDDERCGAVRRRSRRWSR